MQKKFTKADKEEWLRQKKEKIEALSLSLKTLSDQWAIQPDEIVDFLLFKNKFYQYSVRNTMLIYGQNPYATFCASYADFKKMGYSIKRGEKGYKIFVPVTVKMFRTSPQSSWKRCSEATAEELEKIKANSYEIRNMQFFKIGTTFDISQSTCPVEEYPKIFQHVGIDSANHKQLFNGVAAFAQEQLGCSVFIQDVESISLKGYHKPFEHTITISDRLKDTEQFSVLTHELGHAIIHNQASFSNDAEEKSTAQKELEADCFSIMLQDFCGIEPTHDRKSHIASSYRSLAEEQSQSEHEAELTIEDIIKNACDYFSENCEQILNYIKREIDAPQNIANYFSIKYQPASNDYVLYGMNQVSSPFVLKTVSSEQEAITTAKNIVTSLSTLHENLGKPKELKQPYVHILSSTNDILHENSYFSIKDAHNIFSILDMQELTQKDLSHAEYQIVFPQDKIYQGTMDFGTGNGGLITSLEKNWKNQFSFMDIAPDQQAVIQQQVSTMIKNLWDTFDENYIEFYGGLLEKETNQQNITELQERLLNHVSNKRYRETEFNQTGFGHKNPLQYIKIETVESFNNADPEIEEDYNMV